MSNKNKGLAYRTAYNNAILSQNTYASLDYRDHPKKAQLCLNTILYGTTGSGKTRFILKPNLLQMNSNYIVIDPSGEICDAVGESLRRFGYEVKVVDTKNLKNANTYNPLKYCNDEESVKKLVEALISNTADPNSKGGSQDPYWDEAMKQLLCCYVALQTTGPKWDPEHRTWSMIPEIMGTKLYKPAFSNIAEFVRLTNHKYNPRTSPVKPYKGANVGSSDNSMANASDMALIFENIRAYEAEHQGCNVDVIRKPYTLLEWENFKTAPDKTSNTIITATGTRLDPFNIEGVQDYTSSDSTNLDTFIDRPSVIFVIIDLNSATYRFLASFLLSQLFQILYADAEKNSLTQKVFVLPNGEYVRRFKKDEQGDYMNNKVRALRNCRIEEHIIKKYKTGKNTYIDGWYDIIDADGDLVSRRPSKALAEKYVNDLKLGKLTKTKSCQLPCNVRFFIDEFANIGKIPQFLTIISTCRKYRITCMVILQDKTQLEGMYEKDFETIDTNCPFKIFLGGSGNNTNKFLSEKVGQRTIITNNTSEQINQSNSNSFNADARDLIQAAEMGRLDREISLIIIDGENPIRDYKFDYESHFNYKWTHEYADDLGFSEACLFARPEVPPAGLSVIDISKKTSVDRPEFKLDSIPIVRSLNIEAFAEELNLVVQNMEEDDCMNEDETEFDTGDTFEGSLD